MVQLMLPDCNLLSQSVFSPPVVAFHFRPLLLPDSFQNWIFIPVLGVEIVRATCPDQVSKLALSLSPLRRMAESCYSPLQSLSVGQSTFHPCHNGFQGIFPSRLWA